MSSNPAQRVGQVARAMLDGRQNYLLGALELEQLRHKVAAYENDPDFLPFIAIKMDVDQLSVSVDALKQFDQLPDAQRIKVEESVQWAKAISLSQCEILAERFSN